MKHGDQPVAPGRSADGHGARTALSARTRLSALQFSRGDWLLALLLVCGTVLAYQPAWQAGFIWDDDRYVTNNELLTAPDGLKRIWFSLDSPSQYFPLVYTTLRLERAIWDFKPSGYHWVNLLVHAANALLVWRLLRRLESPAAWFGAALFALHPVQVESVAWVTELKNVLSLFFYLLALLSWMGFLKSENRRPKAETESQGGGRGSGVDGRRDKSRFTFHVSRFGHSFYYLLTVFLYLLALSSKTTACTLPVTLLLVAWLKGDRIGWRRLLQTAPFFALGLGMGLVAMWWERYHQGTMGSMFELDLMERLLIASKALWFYLGKLLCPVNLIFMYPKWTIDTTNLFGYVWLVAAFAFAAALFISRRGLGRAVIVGAIFYVASLAPTLGFVMLYTFRYTFVADHYQYVACIGPLALAAIGLTRGFSFLSQPGTKWADEKAKAEALGSHRETGAPKSFSARIAAPSCNAPKWNSALRVEPAFVAVLLLGLSVLTWRQCRMYHDLDTLWTTTLQRNPRCWMALNNMGTMDARQGRFGDAMAQFNKALEIEPQAPILYENLGDTLFEQGHSKEAAGNYQSGLDIDPDHAPLHYKLGNVLGQDGQLDAAIAHFQRALEISPRFAEAHANLANALAQVGLSREAQAHYQRALEIRPDFAEAHYNLALVLLGLRQPQQAIGHLQRAVEIQSDFATAWNSMAWVMATSLDSAARNGAKAVEAAKRAEELFRGQNPFALRTLAAAYAEVGQFSDALATAQHAQQMAGAQGKTGLVEQLGQEMDLYRKGVPLRDSN
ncbi:MAG: hypothetical protein C5B50_30525 [Verrucomicrobia bacterium]|nr:MAG: hypothetical protein C5B50_30525 [Verrucomicrobiota bacterium]